MSSIKTKQRELEDYIYKKNPIKRKIVHVKDEDKPYHHFDKIAKRLYLGDMDAARSKKFFKEKNIKAVLNCTKDVKNYFEKSGVEYLRIPIDDSLKEVDFKKALEYMPLAAEFIYKHVIMMKQTVFVNCVQGRARSCCMVAAFLMAKCGLSSKQACALILKQRPEAFFFGQSLNFSWSIEKFAEQLRKCRTSSINKQRTTRRSISKKK